MYTICVHNTQICVLQEICGPQQNQFVSFQKKKTYILHTQQKYKLELSYLLCWNSITRHQNSAKCSKQVKISKLNFFKPFSTEGTSENADCYRTDNQNIQTHLETRHSYSTVKL